MDVFEAIQQRYSVRQYRPQPVESEKLERVLEAARLAPSAGNRQPWKFAMVSDIGLKQELADAANGQQFIAEAPVIVVGVGFPDLAYKRMGGYGNSTDVDLAIALDHLTLAAAAEGLGTCWIGAFDEAEVKALLNIPAEAKVVAMTPLGYPERPDLIHPIEDAKRKPANEIFVNEKFS